MKTDNTPPLSLYHLVVLTIINVCNYLDRYIVNALLPILAVEFSLNHSQEGRLASAFVIGYTLCSPLFGILGDRYKRPLLLFIGVILWSLATLLSGMASSFMFLYLARILVGVGEASFGVISPGYIKDFESDPIKLNKKLAFFYIAIPVGSALGYIVGGQIASIFSWNYAFYFAALPSLILAFLLPLFQKKNNRIIPKLNPLLGLKTIFKQKVLVLTQTGYIFNTFALTALATFIPAYGVQIGFKLEKINTAFGIILVVAGILGTVLGAKISSILAGKFNSPVKGLLLFTTLGALVAVPVLSFAFITEDKNIFLLCAGICELLIFASLAPINTALVLSAPNGFVTFTQGVTILMINILGALVGPIVVGFASDLVGLKLGLQITSLALFLSGFIWYLGFLNCGQSYKSLKKNGITQ